MLGFLLVLICKHMIVDSVGTVVPLRAAFERPGVVSMHNAASLIAAKFPVQGSTFGLDFVSSQKKRAGALVSCVKSSEVAVVDKANGECFLLCATSTSLLNINHHSLIHSILSIMLNCYNFYMLFRWLAR